MASIKTKIDPTDFARIGSINGTGENTIISLDEIGDIITSEGSKDDANKINTPEGTSFTLSEFLKKEYALRKVFSKPVAEAHRKGDIMLHKLGFIDRPYCSGQSLEYVKKFGLTHYASFAAVKPAGRIEALIDHMMRMTMALRAHFGGAIGWDALNMYMAPYLGGIGDRDIRQIAQTIIYGFNQTVGPHGGQPVFSDINLYWEIPDHFANVPAIGPRGEYTGRTYKDYIKESQALVWQLLNIYKKGDAKGKPFFWPKPNIHITKKFWQTPGHEQFLEHVCDVASKMGNPYFIFDRGSTAKISECCRLQFELSKEDLKDARKPWRMRYAACPYLGVNLPRIAYEAGHDDQKFFEILGRRLELLTQAHLQKYRFLKKLFMMGSAGPLGMLTLRAKGDSETYLRIEKLSFMNAVGGLSDACKYHLGKAIHESGQAFKFGLKVVAFMKKKCDEESNKAGIKILLDQEPAESAMYRFAKLDLLYFPEQAKKIVHGDLKKGEIYYTNSSQLDVDADVDIFERIETEGKFHSMLQGGALTHIWLGESRPSPRSMARLVKKVFDETQNVQVAFSPEFTICNDCGWTTRGIKKRCHFCQSRQVDWITRITGYYSFVKLWNRGKRGELRDRRREKNYRFKK
ncbi:MAG TPA: anaerobic ribonucleoside-triphosphate reductase [Candidatus Bathyarchaeia archaeon]|nr:anaerobic ribonucleoside-triphosphate reductase [Candidatus Bathyarchaeia archaeon]